MTQETVKLWVNEVKWETKIRVKWALEKLNIWSSYWTGKNKRRKY